MFRFEGMDIWKKAIKITDKLFDIADKLIERNLFRFAEQLRGASLSITNNIAEGSGSQSKREFKQFLNFAKRSTYEVVNMLFIFYRRGYITSEVKEKMIIELENLSKMISGFMKSL